MLKVNEYGFPTSAAEALETLERNGRKAVIVGGGAFLGLGEKRAQLAVDLSRAGLDALRTTPDSIEIGAMRTFGDIESEAGPQMTELLFLKHALRDVVGIQLRNMATVGGTVAGRYGFSDFLTALMTLETTVTLTKAGELPLEHFMEQGPSGRDIVEGIRICRSLERFGYAAVRRSTGDFPMMTAAAARCGGKWRIAVGARPGRAVLAKGTMTLLDRPAGSLPEPETLGRALCAELALGTNSRASAAYRQAVVGTLVWDALKEAGYEG